MFSINYSKIRPIFIYYISAGEQVIKVIPQTLKQLIIFLKLHTRTYYQQLIDISAIDNYKSKLRFEVVYQLLSITYNQRLIISVSISEGMPVNSITSIYSSAN
jgi:hypothetical protein